MSAYLKWLNDLLDLAFAEARRQGRTWAWLAGKSGLHWTTVMKLDARLTQYPRARTVYLLCRAVGLTLEAKRSLRVWREAQ